ncbi:MAG: hypothetical protein K9G33_08390 [Sneathiella sp.]|nr:hypothetical protein [Sneathiella sp.]
MIRDVKPTACLLEAFRFVVVHRWPCLLRAVPVVLLTALIAWLETNILASAEYFRMVFNELLYAIFAVYWHRYTILSRERESSSFGLQFGLREIKFAGAMLAYVIVTYILARTFVASGGASSNSTIILFIIVLLLSFLPLMFVFPAIALDQPLAPARFAERIFEMFLPLVGTLLLALVAVAGLYALIYMPFLLMMLLKRPDMAGILFYLVSSFVIMPFIMAVFVSFVAILFRDAIGLEAGQAE